MSYQDCIQACLECMEQCNRCFDDCLKEDNVNMMAKCIRLNRECADICAFAVQAMQTNSQFTNQICELCAEICEACAEECEKHSNHAQHCQDCAQACYRCAKLCREMAAA
ncbi:four-helix bundle copper-binding protein [Geomicrobium sediminis]|uniref:Four-helix bundle copper-binding protein n=1 Tax=Geomicrobium sediminis TaxID=1347788 RepID=A0ABS2PFR7_9BACL|nr:four-helix bundle copper-binding protein [Geomicrobium sediminis]EZH64198.1 hypothetical protein DH09_00220 [Bacillaceae bacterium JMAK1]MBM7634280.1 hypothetical protein [Geomicrobium sediminis]